MGCSASAGENRPQILRDQYMPRCFEKYFSAKNLLFQCCFIFHSQNQRRKPK